uniref:Protein FAM13A n=1 Tax=Steinernema glaseri TaxID=37863 RepID=A0A1I7Y7X1_9BILA
MPIGHEESAASLMGSMDTSCNASRDFDFTRARSRLMRADNVTLDTVASVEEISMQKPEQQRTQASHERSQGRHEVERPREKNSDNNDRLLQQRRRSEKIREDCLAGLEVLKEHVKSNAKKRRSSHKKPIGNPDALFLRIENHPQPISVEEYERMRAMKKQKELRTSQYLQSHFGGSNYERDIPVQARDQASLNLERRVEAAGQLRENQPITEEEMKFLQMLRRLKAQKQQRKPPASAPSSHRSSEHSYRPESRQSRPQTQERERIVLREQGTSPFRDEEIGPVQRERPSTPKPSKQKEMDGDCGRLSRLDIGIPRSARFTSSGTSPLKQEEEVRRSPRGWLDPFATKSPLKPRSQSRPRTATATAPSQPFMAGKAGTGNTKCFQLSGVKSDLLQLVRTNYPSLCGMVKQVLDSKPGQQTVLQKVEELFQRRLIYLQGKLQELDSKYGSLREIDPERPRVGDKLVELDKEKDLTEKKLQKLREMLPPGSARMNQLQELRLLKVVFAR